MNKTQALQAFWGRFDLPAYQAGTVPEGLDTPYITYQTATGRLGDRISLTGSVWDRGTSWVTAQAAADRIGRYLAREHVPMPWRAAGICGCGREARSSGGCGTRRTTSCGEWC